MASRIEVYIRTAWISLVYTQYCTLNSSTQLNMGNLCTKSPKIIEKPIKPLKPALKTADRDQVEYDNILEQERAKSKAKKLEEFLKLEKEKYDQEHLEPRILLLGTSDAGKSTFLKQLKILYGAGFTKDELEKAKSSILFTLFAICQKLIQDMNSDILDFHKDILSYSKEQAKLKIPPEIIKTMISMWSDPTAKMVFESYGDFFPATSSYFFDKLDVLASSSYVMTPEDMLLLRNVTQNISDNVFEFTINKKKEAMHFIDVSGLKYHRKRWIPYFQDVLSIIFIVAISSYDQMMSEDKETNRMVDAIGLFKHIINHPLLAKPDMILFFNKKDIYEVKVKKISIKNHFPDYTGKEYSVSDGIAYFKNAFKLVNKNEKKSVTFHLTCCTDTKLMQKIISDIVMSILKTDLNNIVLL